jgi:hypothetical protein
VVFEAIYAAIRAHGSVDVGLPAGPNFFLFSDPAQSIRALLSAGFQSPYCRLVPQVWRVSDPDEVFRVFTEGTVRAAATLRAQSSSARETINATMRRTVAAHRRGDSYCRCPLLSPQPPSRDRDIQHTRERTGCLAKAVVLGTIGWRRHRGIGRPGGHGLQAGEAVGERSRPHPEAAQDGEYEIARLHLRARIAEREGRARGSPPIRARDLRAIHGASRVYR